MQSQARLVGRLVVGCFTVIALVSASGCGGGGAAKTQKVSGKITTVDGAPAKGASVAFSATGKGYQTTGITGDDGTYQLSTFEDNDGAPEGEYAVSITDAEGPLTIVEGQTKVTVKPASNTFDFKVKKDAAPAAAAP